MSRKRREQRDHKKGIKTTVRAVVVTTYERGKQPVMNVDCGGWPADFVAKMLINAGKKLLEKVEEVKTNEVTQGIREDSTTTEKP